ncbi:hypothetical protein IAU59_005952 [Kwoniella sp. CBS 9459]
MRVPKMSSNEQIPNANAETAPTAAATQAAGVHPNEQIQTSIQPPAPAGETVTGTETQTGTEAADQAQTGQTVASEQTGAQAVQTQLQDGQEQAADGAEGAVGGDQKAGEARDHACDCE